VTVAELIKRLLEGVDTGEWALDSPVRTEGCDCDALATGVVKAEGEAYITR
jgi:hypothetical protein